MMPATRTFTPLEQPEGDRARMDHLRDLFLATAANIVPLACQGPPFVVHGATETLTHRIILYQRPELFWSQPCAFVVFLGKRRHQIPGAMLDAIDHVDQRLMDQCVADTPLLGYASQRLPDGNWSNMVLFHRAHHAAAFSRSAMHQQASQIIAPQYYDWIRLHFGAFPSGIGQAGMVITTTKYITYHDHATLPQGQGR